jgi:hypothetical protein
MLAAMLDQTETGRCLCKLAQHRALYRIDYKTGCAKNMDYYEVLLIIIP